MIKTKTAQTILLLVWFIAAAFLFAFMILRSNGNIYGSKVDYAWKWFLPNIAPTLSLIISAAIFDFTQIDDNQKQSNKLLFGMTLGISIFYLFCLGLTVLNITVYPNPIYSMNISEYWLVFFQSLVSISVGIFFVNRK